MIEDFLNAIRAAGLNPPSHIEPGKFHRFPGADKSASNGAGYCKLFPDGEAGIFGDWSTGFSGVWQSAKAARYTEYERQVYADLIAKAKIEAEELRREDQASAARYAAKTWDNAPPATDDHQYLKAKGVKSHGLRLLGADLLMPLYSAPGVMATYQTITPDGSKRLLKNGCKKGSSFFIPGNTDKVFICEGYATGASVHEATGHAVIIAVDAGNLIHVIENQVAHHKMIIAADNDHGGEKNTGLDTARAIKEKYPAIDIVFPPAIEGRKATDWNDYAAAHVLKDVKRLLLREQKIITAKDLPRDDISTQFPPEIFEADIIKMGIRAVEDLGAPKIIQYNLVSVLSHIATAIAGKIRFNHAYPSFIFIRVGGSGTGKSDADTYLTAHMAEETTTIIKRKDKKGREIDEKFNDFYGPTDIASGAGLMRAIMNKPRSLVMIDEVVDVFSAGDGKYIDSNAKSKTKALLELATMAGGVPKNTAYSDVEDNISLRNAVFNMTGNATKNIFKALTHASFNDGMIRRLDISCYDGLLHYRTNRPTSNSDDVAAFTYHLKALRDSESPKPPSTRGVIIPPEGAINIGADEDAWREIESYSIQTTDEANAEHDESLRGIKSNKYISALRFALIHHAGDINNLYTPLTAQDIIFGKLMAEAFAAWKLHVLFSEISAGEYDDKCRDFIRGLKACIRAGRPATIKMMALKIKPLKNFSGRDWDDVIKVLTRKGMIKEIPGPRGQSAYELIADED